MSNVIEDFNQLWNSPNAFAVNEQKRVNKEILQKRLELQKAAAIRDSKVVSAEQILRKAIESFKNVFGETKSFGLYSGTSHEIDKDFVFATMQTMATHYEDFAKEEFQVVVADEAHRTGAESYQKMMKCFNPDLWIGMTASPDRTDKFDVYAAFDHNIAHEIRLQEAMRLNLLCPFHYYGITDIFLDGEEKEKRDFAKLICDDRVRFHL